VLVSLRTAPFSCTDFMFARGTLRFVELTKGYTPGNSKRDYRLHGNDVERGSVMSIAQ